MHVGGRVCDNMQGRIQGGGNGCIGPGSRPNNRIPTYILD